MEQYNSLIFNEFFQFILQDDNIQGNYYDNEDDDDEIYEEEKPAKKQETEDKNGTSGSVTELEKEVAEIVAAVEKQKEAEEKSRENAEDKAALESVAKILEETKVPELNLPELPEIGAVGSSKKVSGKSVQFSAQISKEFAITKMALVQPKSNMAGPMDVDDEFEFDDEPELKIPTARKILKRSR